MFRRKTGIMLSYARQGYVYFVSLGYLRMDEAGRGRIDAMCLRAAGGNEKMAAALLAYVTTDRGVRAIEDQYGVSRSALYRAVKHYYEHFPAIF